MKLFLKELFKRQKLVIMLFVLIFGYGIYSYFVIPKQEMPDFSTPYMVLSITAPSMDASSIEDEIIDNVEKTILTYDDVLEVRSMIYDNYAVVITQLTFDTDDPAAVSLDIYNKIHELSLSDNITDISYNVDFDDPHIIFAVHSDDLSEVDLLQRANEFRNNLLLIDEISTVKVDNAYQKEVIITLDQFALDVYNLTMIDVYQLIYANTLNLPLGSISTIQGNISISGDIDIDELSDLEQIILIPEIPTITPKVTLGDVSTITLENTSSKVYQFNGENAVFLSVFFKKDIDFTKLGDTVLNTKFDFLDESNETELSINEMLFLPDYVEEQINDVFYSLLIAIAVVMVVVLFGIGARNSLLIVSTIPIIIFATVGILYLFGFQLHKLTIVGLIIAIGILVDNQIVITEGTKRYIDMGMDKVEAAKEAIRENIWPVLSSTLTTIAAFIVLVLLPGFLGQIVGSMPLTVIITISFSFILSMTLSPILAVLFLKPGKKKASSRIHEQNIKKMIATTIKFPMIWILFSILTLGGSIYLAFSQQEIDLYPNDERAILYIDFESDLTNPMYTTEMLRDDIITVIKENTALESYASSIGGDLPRFHFSSKLINELPYAGRLYVTYDLDEKELLDYQKELESSLSEIDGNITVNTLELSPPIAPVRMFLQSENKTKLDTLTTTLFTEIQDQDYVKTSYAIENIQSLKYSITYDFEAMASAMITKAEIDSLIAIHINGLDLEIFQFNNETINVNLDSTISSHEDLTNLSISSSVTSMSYPLSSFITINEKIDYVVINRLNNKNVVILDLYPKDIDNFELEKNITEIATDYDTSNVTITYGGENEMFTEISGDLIRASIIAIVLIFIIMFIQFNNFIKPLIIFLTIPLSFTGSFLFLWIFNSPITATALVGMVSLLGVTVNTGILLVEYITRHHNNGSDVRDACIDSVYLRFRPIMLTSITTILGLIPLLLTGGNFFRPLAITFMGGLVTSTLITIFLVPSVYYMVYSKQKTKKAN
jgi:multidrug efflux pump subunit AcrB